MPNFETIDGYALLRSKGLFHTSGLYGFGARLFVRTTPRRGLAQVRAKGETSVDGLHIVELHTPEPLRVDKFGAVLLVNPRPHTAACAATPEGLTGERYKAAVGQAVVPNKEKGE